MVFIKTRTKHASRDGIELAVFKAFGEVLIEALSFGFGVTELVLVRWLAAMLVYELSFVYTMIYGIYKQTHNQEIKVFFIVELESEIIRIWSLE